VAKFKIGDVVRIRSQASYASIKHQGQSLKIISPAKTNQATFDMNCYYIVDCKCSDVFEHKCGIWEYEMIPIKLEPKTEIDFLDCFKQNFEDGI
jgi:hypothetical protein